MNAVFVLIRPSLPCGRGGGTTTCVGTGGTTWPTTASEVTAVKSYLGGGGNLIFVGGAGTVLILR